MARCTAPVRGHSSAAAAAACPACRYRSSSRYSGGYSSSHYPSTTNSNYSSSRSVGGRKSSKPRWSHQQRGQRKYAFDIDISSAPFVSALYTCFTHHFVVE